MRPFPSGQTSPKKSRPNSLFLDNSDIDLIMKSPSPLHGQGLATRLLARKNAPKSSGSPSRVTKRQALLVDDVKVTQMVTRAALHQAGFNCDIAGDGIEAVAMAKKTPYFVILMDVQLPKLNGVEATKQIRDFESESGRTKSTIFGLTGNCEESSLSAYNDAGMDGCIEKGCIVSQAMHEALAMHAENSEEFVFINSRNVQSLRNKTGAGGDMMVDEDEDDDEVVLGPADGNSKDSSSLKRLSTPVSGASSPVPEDLPAHNTSATRHSALLVDDVKITQKITGLALKKSGYACDSSLDGEDAIAKAREKHYDVILMDVQLPGLDGVEATKQIRMIEKELGRKPSTILGLTGNCSEKDLLKYTDSGMDGCIEKGCVVSRAMHEALAILNANPDQFVFVDSHNIHFGLGDDHKKSPIPSPVPSPRNSQS